MKIWGSQSQQYIVRMGVFMMNADNMVFSKCCTYSIVYIIIEGEWLKGSGGECYNIINFC